MSAATDPGARYLVTTVVLIAGALTWTVVDRPVRPAPALTRPGSTTARASLVVPPTAADLLARRDLAFTPPQRARLEALAAEWQRDITPLEAQVRAATDEFTRYLTAAGGAGRARLDDVRARSLEVQESSAALRAHRGSHSAAALAVLTPAQEEQMRGGSR